MLWCFLFHSSGTRTRKETSLSRVQQNNNEAAGDEKCQFDGDRLLLPSRVCVNISVFLRRAALSSPERTNRVSVVGRLEAAVSWCLTLLSCLEQCYLLYMISDAQEQIWSLYQSQLVFVHSEKPLLKEWFCMREDGGLRGPGVWNSKRSQRSRASSWGNSAKESQTFGHDASLRRRFGSIQMGEKPKLNWGCNGG